MYHKRSVLFLSFIRTSSVLLSILYIRLKVTVPGTISIYFAICTPESIIYDFPFVSLGNNDFSKSGHTLKEISKLLPFKVNGYSAIFIFASHHIRGELLKERIYKENQCKVSPLRVDPILGRRSPADKHTGNHEKYLTLKTLRK